ncbi:Acetyl-CoA:oxalate CoA-transferase [Alphaproteobacteria bacterium SO-S41]|nr:Acetyl-CoA:oxalate CoA-transferase [Alphaproteobacteria bacterium SO-S41]
MTATGPLTGIRVIDLTRVLAGPYCTMMLAEQGAEVIKVETPDGGDDARHIGPFLGEQSGYFISINRGKKSIALNLKDETDRGHFLKLLETADVLVENYRGGTMEKLGLGWDVLHPKFPKLIYCAISGFGHSGPYMTRPAYDMIVQAMSGVMSVTGYEGQPPARVGVSIGDLAAGMFASSGIQGALFHRLRTGESQKLDISMLDCQVALLENAVAQTFAKGKPPGPIGARHPAIAPFGMFHTRDGYIAVAAGNNPLFRKLCATIDAAHLIDDPRYATPPSRMDHVAALTADLNAAFGKRDRAEWCALLDEAGIPCGPINDVADIMADPQIAARNMIISVDQPGIGAFPSPGNPVKSSLFLDPATRPAAPALDEHRAEILKGLG